MGYIIPYDGTFDEKLMYRNISMNQIKNDISRKLPAKHVFFVMDCCYSGLLVTRAGSHKARRNLTYLQEITKEPVRQVLTAGNQDQQVLDGGPFDHSVFTGRLIEALKNSNEYITATELSMTVKEKVFSDAQMRGHTQTPQHGRLFGMGDFVFIVDAGRKLTAKIGKLSEQKQKLEQQEHVLAQQLANLEKKLTAEKFRLESSQNDMELIEARRHKAQLEAKKWEQLEKQRQLEKEKQRYKQDLIEAQKEREEQRKLQQEIQKITKLEQQKQKIKIEERKRKLKEEEQQQRHKLERLAQMKIAIAQQQRKIEELRLKSLTPAQAKQKAYQLEKELSKTEQYFNQGLSEALKKTTAHYYKKKQEVEKQIKKVDSYIRKKEILIDQKKAQTLKSINPDQSMFETEEEYHRRMVQEKEQALLKIQEFAARLRQNLEPLYALKSKYQKRRQTLLKEEEKEKQQVTQKYNQEKNKQKDLFYKQLQSILAKIFVIPIKKITLEKYDIERRIFLGTFHLAGIAEEQEVAYRFYLRLNREQARELYQKRQLIWAKMEIRLTSKLQKELQGIAIIEESSGKIYRVTSADIFQEDPYEPNNAKAQATYITPGNYRNLTLWESEEDWYKIILNGRKEVTINLNARAGQPLPTVEVLGDNAQKLDSVYPELKYVLQGTSYLRISGKTCQYDLKIAAHDFQEALKQAIISYYNKSGEWAGTFSIGYVEKMRIVRDPYNSQRLEVHAKYKYIPVPGGRRSDTGFDQRVFYIKIADGNYQVTRMGGHNSAHF